ncbi:MAG: hypothetical protein ACXQS2_04700, partial [Methermicoccaceae archaeon]
IKHLKHGELPARDERTVRLGAYGISYSWLATLIFISILILLEELEALTLNTTHALGYTFLVMIVSAVVFQRYFFRKGDVQ